MKEGRKSEGGQRKKNERKGRKRMEKLTSNYTTTLRRGIEEVREIGN